MTSLSKIFIFIFCGFVFGLSMTSCLEGNDSEVVPTNIQNATIRSFSFSNNNDVCRNLSGYKFSIDNLGISDPALSAKLGGSGIIFNPDSLPMGSVPDSIQINVESTNASSILIKQYDAEGNLKKITNYADTQVVFFKDYAVTSIDITSNDGLFKRKYAVKVNVHKVYGDTICWKYSAKDLWETTEITDQKTVSLGSDLYWYAEYNHSTACLRKGVLENVNDWSEPVEIVSEEKPLVSTIINWNNTLYAVGENGAMLSSTDGIKWSRSASSVEFVNILGLQFASKRYQEHLHAIVKDDEGYKFARSFDGVEWEIGKQIPSDFPIKNFSNPVSDKAKPSSGNITSRLYIVGGETADGTIISSTWSCDGDSWVPFRQPYLPPMTCPAIIKYTFDVDAPESLWLLWGGIWSDGTVKNTLYFSENKGVTWKPMKAEYAPYSATEQINPVGGVSAILDKENYQIYFFGGVDSEGCQQANIFGGRLIKLLFKKVK